MYLDDLDQFSERERETLLKKLLQILQNDDQMVYEIAWDIPSRLLPYFESSFDFFSGPLYSAPCVVTIIAIFNTITAKGNPKELFLKSVECLEQLEWKPLKDADDPRNKDVADRFFEIKFVSIYECIFSMMQRAEAQYPSRFLAMATTAMLSFLAGNLRYMSIRSVFFVLRRYFMLARDYNPRPPKDKEVSEKELSLQRKLLQRFVTDVVAIGLQKYPAKWATRFIFELKSGLAFHPSPQVRASSYDMADYTTHFVDIIYRLTHLAMSLDIDIEDSFATLVNESITAYDAETDAKSDSESESSTIIPAKPDFDFTRAKTPESINLSNEGIFLLATSLRFEDRTNPKMLQISLIDLIKLTKRFMSVAEEDSSGHVSAGLHDAVCFWTLWTMRKVGATEVQALKKPVLFEFLHHFGLITLSSSDKELKQLAYSIATKLLVQTTQELRYEYLIDTIESSPYMEERENAWRMLKDFVVTPKAPVKKDAPKEGANVNTITESVETLSISSAPTLIEPTPARLDKIEGLIVGQIRDIQTAGNGVLAKSFPLVVASLSFMAAVKTAPEHVKVVREEIQKIVDSKNAGNAASEETVKARKTLLEAAVAKLKMV